MSGSLAILSHKRTLEEGEVVVKFDYMYYHPNSNLFISHYYYFFESYFLTYHIIIKFYFQYYIYTNTIGYQNKRSFGESSFIFPTLRCNVTSSSFHLS